MARHLLDTDEYIDRAFSARDAEIAALKARLAEAVHLLKGWSAYQASTELMAQTKALIRAADSASGDA
jgi:hypothetical protein